MKRVILATAIAAMVGGLPMSGNALAGSKDGYTIDSDFLRRGTGSTSGSGHTVEDECPEDPSGNAWQDATASLKVEQGTGNSKVEIEVEGAAPNTVFTVWLRMAGSGPGDENGNGGGFGGSPMTGGGATPLVASYSLDGVIHYSPPFSGTPTPTNGFTTNGSGEGEFTIDLDFPVVGGAYPFQAASDAAVTDLRDAGSTWPLERKPSPVANPEDPNISAGFLMRIVSHCQDGLGHGLSPSKREAWFQYP